MDPPARTSRLTIINCALGATARVSDGWQVGSPRVMDVYFDTLATAAERSEVEEWSSTHDSSDIEYISIEKPAVLVHGSRGHFVAVTGTARRHGKLSGELTAALAVMRTEALR